MTFFRWFLGLPFAALVTAALFIIMAGLIRPQAGYYLPPTQTPDINITPKIKPTETEQKQPKPVDHVKKQPKTIIDPTLPTDKPGSVIVDPNPDPTTTDGLNIFKRTQPIIRVTPPYPEACRSRGIEGDVLVQFDVTPEGNVVNVQIISAPDRCFNRIVSAIAAWKYPPAYDGDRPVMRYGVTEQFHFELTD